MKIVSFALTISLLATPCLGRPDANAFRYSKAIVAEGVEQDEILSVRLDRDVYAATRLDWADLRVTDQRGVDRPCILERLTSNEVTLIKRDVPSAVDRLDETDDNRVVVFVSVTGTNDAAIRGLHIDTPLKDFERRVSVLGLAADSRWEEVVTGALLYDYSRYMDVRDTTIRLPRGYYRSYRVEIDNVTDEKASPMRELQRTVEGAQEVRRTDRTTLEKRPFRISRITLWTEDERETVKVDRKTDYTLKSFAVSQHGEAKQTIVLVTTHREPLTEFAVEAEGSFSRRAEVQVPVMDGMRKTWRPVAGGVISRISFRDINRSQTALTFPEQRSDEYRIVIEDRDNPPLQVNGVAARGNSYHLQFLAAPGSSYVLRYGSDTASHPDYEAGALLGALRGGFAPREVTMGPQVENPAFKSGGGWGFIGGKVFLGAAIAVVVITLAIALFRAGRGISRPSDTPS